MPVNPKIKKNKSVNNKGFTLIEIAVVLVIIGLIIGAAVKGKDLIQSGKQKKFYTSVVKAWELVIVSYYDRTGMLLGDGATNGGSGSSNGQFDTIQGNNFDAANGVDATLRRIGLEVPNSNTSESGENSFKGTYSGTQTVQLRLQYIGGAVSSNCLYFVTMPTDLAIAIDGMADGTMDGTAGNVRRWPVSAWPDASTTPTVNVAYILDVP